ncbi:MAG: hypothetical protein P3X23_010545 [Thermosynechococcus sp. Uc]|uniref:hypothetical protein n=1 Tax=Thermosynechococcus sp. Uc TaxID=3034853 RepID=UPI00259F41BE|nr:hypothetical protein [Thermosynechococcus sp. Uc]MDM7327534.1 hypothetical protein [Thermosynechococcus sp. Uc]
MSELADAPAEKIHQGLLNLLRPVFNQDQQDQVPEKGVARSLYEWRLERLQSSA